MKRIGRLGTTFLATCALILAMAGLMAPRTQAQSGTRNNFLVAFDVLGATRDYPDGPGVFFNGFVDDYISLTCISNYSGTHDLWYWASSTSGGPTTLGEVDCYPLVVIDSIVCSGATYLGGTNIGVQLPVGMPYTEQFTDSLSPQWRSTDVPIQMGAGSLGSGTLAAVLYSVMDDFGNYNGHAVQSMTFHFEVRKQYANLTCTDWVDHGDGYEPVGLQWVTDTMFETYCDTEFTFTVPGDFSD